MPMMPTTTLAHIFAALTCGEQVDYLYQTQVRQDRYQAAHVQAQAIMFLLQQQQQPDRTIRGSTLNY